MVTWRAARAKADSVSAAGRPNSPRTATEMRGSAAMRGTPNRVPMDRPK